MKRKIIKIFVGVFFIGALLFNISLNANIDKSNGCTTKFPTLHFSRL